MGERGNVGLWVGGGNGNGSGGWGRSSSGGEGGGKSEERVVVRAGMGVWRP